REGARSVGDEMRFTLSRTVGRVTVRGSDHALGKDLVDLIAVRVREEMLRRARDPDADRTWGSTVRPLRADRESVARLQNDRHRIGACCWERNAATPEALGGDTSALREDAKVAHLAVAGCIRSGAVTAAISESCGALDWPAIGVGHVHSPGR